MSTFAEAMQRFTQEMGAFAVKLQAMAAANPALRRLLGLPLRDRHHPPKLPIDGAAYARRRAARKRRR